LEVQVQVKSKSKFKWVLRVTQFFLQMYNKKIGKHTFAYFLTISYKDGSLVFLRAYLNFYKLKINPDSYRIGFNKASKKAFIEISN